MGQHRAAFSVRVDGLLAVLSALRGSDRIVAAALVDRSSGLVLDGYTTDPAYADLEVLGAGHLELVRTAETLAGPGCGAGAELVVSQDERCHHLLRLVPDPYGDRLVLSVVVQGTRRQAALVLDRLRAVPVAVLTAGPTLHNRPVEGTWLPSWLPVPHSPGPRSAPAGGR